MKTMQAVVWAGPEQLQLASIARPALQAPDDVVLRVRYASTCGTDLHIYRGVVPGFEPGTVIGHEFVGTVEEVGAAVSRLQPGQWVRGSDFIACGHCQACDAGRYTQCVGWRLFGFSGLHARLDGSLAEFVRVPWAETVLTPLPTGTDPRAGLLAADVLPTALGALRKLQLAAGERLAVVGAGPVGTLTAFLVKRHGLDPLLLETSPQRAERARHSGLRVREVEAQQPLSDSAKDLVGAFDAAVDAVGGERGLRAALDTLRPGGRLVGVGTQVATFPLAWGNIMQREISLHFVIGDPIGQRAEVDRALPFCEPVLDALFSDRLKLQEVPDYFAALHRRECFKAIVDIEESAL